MNRYKPHVLVVPEDDANRQLANGFLQNPARNLRAIQVLPPAGGWVKVLDNLLDDYHAMLDEFPQRHLVLLIDFDEQVEARLARFKDSLDSLSAKVRDRVYLLGTQDEPEPLRKACRVSLESIGEELGNACADGEAGLWDHAMLKHNHSELERLTHNVKPFLFQGTP